jgi:hypothetical protein
MAPEEGTLIPNETVKARFLAMASRMAIKTAMPCLTAVEA